MCIPRSLPADDARVYSEAVTGGLDASVLELNCAPNSVELS